MRRAKSKRRQIIFIEPFDRVRIVHHPPYPLAEVTLEAWDVNPLLQAGFEDPKRPPDHVIGSPGVDVLIYALTP